MKKRVVKIVSLTLAASILVGGLSVFNYNSRAEEVVAEKQKEKIESNDIKNSEELFKYLESLGKEVTITNIEDLYTQLESKEDINSDVMKELLASSTEDVIKEFISKEIVNAYNIYAQLGSNAENVVVNGEDSDYIKDVKIQEYESLSGNNYKTVSKAVSKYGTTVKCELQDIDEELPNVRETWFPLLSSKRRETKKYGDRKFVWNGVIDLKIFSFGIKYTFNYNVSEKGLKAKSIKTQVEDSIPSAISLKIIENKITDSSASKVGENIDGCVISQMTGEWFGLIKAGQVKQKYWFIITIKKWDKKGKSMELEHYSEPYQNVAL